MLNITSTAGLCTARGGSAHRRIQQHFDSWNVKMIKTMTSVIYASGNIHCTRRQYFTRTKILLLCIWGSQTFYSQLENFSDFCYSLCITASCWQQSNTKKKISSCSSCQDTTSISCANLVVSRETVTVIRKQAQGQCVFASLEKICVLSLRQHKATEHKIKVDAECRSVAQFILLLSSSYPIVPYFCGTTVR